MRVEIHDLKHEKWALEAEPTETIGELKVKNCAERGLDESANQKMIYSGKILKDTDTLSSINYAEGKGFLVCMVSKSRKPAAKPATNSEPSGQESSSTVKEQNSKQSPPNVIPASAQPNNSEPILTGPSTLATGPQLNVIVANIMDMGYSQQMVLRAMRQAFNNPDRAVEYLVTGQVEEAAEDAEHPDDAEPNTEDEHSEQLAAKTEEHGALDASATSIDRDLFDAAEEQENAEADADVVVEGEDIDFHELLGLEDEQLDQLRAAVRRNPQELLRLLDPLLRSNPQVAQTLVNNLDQFMWFLHSSGGTADDAEIESAEPGTQTVSISQDEEAAIHRIMELGFNFDTVAMAFIACDRDEQLTANYLLEHGNDE